MLVSAVQVTCSQGWQLCCGSIRQWPAAAGSVAAVTSDKCRMSSIGKQAAVRMDQAKPPMWHPAFSLVAQAQRFGNVVGVRRGSSYGPCASGRHPQLRLLVSPVQLPPTRMVLQPRTPALSGDLWT